MCSDTKAARACWASLLPVRACSAWEQQVGSSEKQAVCLRCIMTRCNHVGQHYTACNEWVPLGSLRSADGTIATRHAPRVYTRRMCDPRGRTRVLSCDSTRIRYTLMYISSAFASELCRLRFLENYQHMNILLCNILLALYTGIVPVFAAAQSCHSCLVGT